MAQGAPPGHVRDPSSRPAACSSALEAVSARSRKMQPWVLSGRPRKMPPTQMAATASLCYAIGTRHAAAVTPSWSSRTLRILVAGTAVLLLAGVAAGLLTAGYHLILGVEATHAFCAPLRPFVISAAAL